MLNLIYLFAGGFLVLVGLVAFRASLRTVTGFFCGFFRLYGFAIILTGIGINLSIIISSDLVLLMGIITIGLGAHRLMRVCDEKSKRKEKRKVSEGED